MNGQRTSKEGKFTKERKVSNERKTTIERKAAKEKKVSNEIAEYLEELKRRLAELQSEQIPGKLEIKTNGKRPEYFYCTREGGVKHREYIPKARQEEVKRLAQQTYNNRIERVLTVLSKKRFLSYRQIERTIDGVYQNLHPLRQALVIPVQETAEQQFSAWKAKPYQGLTFREGDPEGILTNNNERVRSKSEKILADLFLAQGIFYKYECPLFLRDEKIFYPDFTFYHPMRKQEIYWEHFGRMDLPEYALRSASKIRTYERNGIFLGDRLIVTFEGDSLILDSRSVQDLIDHYELRLCAR